MSIPLSSHDLHSKPLSVALEGPVTFLPDGRIAIAVVEHRRRPASASTIDAPLGISGTVKMIVPAGEMKLQLVSPPLAGGAAHDDEASSRSPWLAAAAALGLALVAGDGERREVVRSGSTCAPASARRAARAVPRDGARRRRRRREPRRAERTDRGLAARRSARRRSPRLIVGYKIRRRATAAARSRPSLGAAVHGEVPGDRHARERVDRADGARHPDRRARARRGARRGEGRTAGAHRRLPAPRSRPAPAVRRRRRRRAVRATTRRSRTRC